MKPYAYRDRGIVVIDGVGDFAAEYLDDVIQALTTLRDRMNQGQDVTQIAMSRRAGWPLPDLFEVEGAA